jgi:sugar phosphate isomerase/epimerase
MNRFKVGVRLESLGLPLRKGLAEAARLGVPGVQIDARGDLSPDNLTATGRREFRNLLKAHNLELTALGCPLRRGLDSTEDQQPRLEHVRAVMSLSYDLGPRLTVVQAGAVPGEGEAEAVRGAVLRESLLDLSRYGDRTGTKLALETGLESGEALAAYLKGYDTGSLAANLDPANLLLHGFDPYESVHALTTLIAQVHARDARRSTASRTAQEVPLGRGDIDWLRFLEVLAEVEYRGWLVVERETGTDRIADMAAGVEFLRRMIA